MASFEALQAEIRAVDGRVDAVHERLTIEVPALIGDAKASAAAAVQALGQRVSDTNTRLQDHDKRQSAAIAEVRADVNDLKLWRAGFLGEIKGAARSSALFGALAGGLLSQAPALFRWLAGH